jgi:hypothetical protein
VPLEDKNRTPYYGFLSTWGDVARGAHNSEGFALAGEDLGDAKVTNLDMIQGPYTYIIYGLYSRQGSYVIKATEIRIFWRFPEAAVIRGDTEVVLSMCSTKSVTKLRL